MSYYNKCPLCMDTGGQTGHHPEQPCPECGLPFMADETAHGRQLIELVTRAFVRGVKSVSNLRNTRIKVATALLAAQTEQLSGLSEPELKQAVRDTLGVADLLILEADK